MGKPGHSEKHEKHDEKYPQKPSYSEKEKYDTKHRKPSANSYKPSYNIKNTLKRLQDIKQNHLERKGLPALPNPWDKLNAPSKSMSKSESRKSPFHDQKSPKRKGWPARPEFEDHHYESHKRNGYAASERVGASRANPLALLIAPLAGIALLTAAAAVAINPVLVTVSVTGKRRKRRDLDTVIQANQSEGISPELEEKIHEMQVLEKFMSTVPENTNYQ